MHSDGIYIGHTNAQSERSICMLLETSQSSDFYLGLYKFLLSQPSHQQLPMKQVNAHLRLGSFHMRQIAKNNIQRCAQLEVGSSGAIFEHECKAASSGRCLKSISFHPFFLPNIIERKLLLKYGLGERQSCNGCRNHRKLRLVSKYSVFSAPIHRSCFQIENILSAEDDAAYSQTLRILLVIARGSIQHLCLPQKVYVKCKLK